MINFDNTEIAFKSKNNKALNKGYLMFKVLANSSIVKISSRAVPLAIKLNLPINWAVKPTIYSHFVGGETLEKCLPVVEMLKKFNVKAILDYSVEGKDSDEDMKKALDETLHSVRNAATHANIPFAVFKPTAFCTRDVLEKASKKLALTPDETKKLQFFQDSVGLLCQTAAEIGKPILIDAEDSYYQDYIDETVTQMMEKHNQTRAIVFNTLQMYRHDRLEFLKKSYEKAIAGNYFLGVKFVRGAYMEKERERAQLMGYTDPIQPNKESTDRDFNAALKFCIDHLDQIFIFNGTHNEYSSAYLAQLMLENKIEKTDPRVYFSQLYGMSDHISYNLASLGYNIAKYVPYGPMKHVLPYLIRRAEENTSVAGQTGRELNLILKEKARRKSAGI